MLWSGYMMQELQKFTQKDESPKFNENTQVPTNSMNDG